ncbi:MAG: ATP-binding protein [Candidatus Latescibacterota bacterium]
MTPLWRALTARFTGARPGPVDVDRAIHELSQALNLIADVEPLVNTELGQLHQVLDADRLVLLVGEDEDGPYRVLGQRGHRAEDLADLRLDRGSHLAGWLRTNGCPLILSQHQGAVAYLGQEEQALLERLRADVVVPLTAANQLVGLLLAGRASPWQSADLDLFARLGPRLGLALQNALLLRQSRLRLRRLYRTERLATVGQLAAGAAHEIRNPLTGIRSTIQYRRRDYEGNADKQELVDELIAEVDRIDQIIAGLLSFARPSDPSLEPVDLAELLRQAAHLVATSARKAQVTIILDLPELPCLVKADPAQLKQVFLNLYLNAIQAMREGGILEVRLTEAATGFQIEVRDTGIGIPAEHLDKVFDPFYTTKEEGTGLGLAICYGIIARHGGQIDLASPSGQGTCVTVRLGCEAAAGIRP